MIRAVVFDADETLLDLRPAVTGGLVAVLEEMRRVSPAAAGVSLADLESDWDAVLDAHRAAPAARIRRAALTRRAGLRAIWLNRLGVVRPTGVTRMLRCPRWTNRRRSSTGCSTN